LSSPTATSRCWRWHSTSSTTASSVSGSCPTPRSCRAWRGRRASNLRVVSDRDELLQRIKDDAVLHGRVVLSSGKEADYYVDLRRVTLASNAAPLVGTVMLELTQDWDYDAVGGLTLGADPVATAMLHAAASAGRK